MREHKYRVWNKISKEYTYFVSPILSLDKKEGYPLVFPRKSDCNAKTMISGYGDLEQFTGLKDSEGREIWEGDVVEDNCNEVGGRYLGSRILRITFMDGCFSAESRHNAVCLYEMTPGTFLKVIGNIHEEAPHDPS